MDILDEPGARQRAPWKRSRAGRIARLALTAALLAWVCHRHGIELGGAALTGVSDPAWLGMAPAAALGLIPLANAHRWRVLLAQVGIVERLLPLMRVSLLGSFFGLLLPTTLGPDAARVVLIERRHPAARGLATAVVVADKALGFLVFSLVGLAGAVAAHRVAGEGLVGTMGAITAGVVLALAVVTHPRAERLVASLLARLHAPAALAAYVSAAASTLGRIPLARAGLRVLPAILAYQLTTVTLVWAIFLAFGHALPWTLHAAFVPISLIIATVPASIGGFGLREGAFVHLYGGVGVPPEVAFSVSVLLFVSTMGLAALGGGAWAAVEQVRGVDAAPPPG